MKSFTFVTSESPSASRRLGVPIECVCYYRIGTSEEPRFYTIELTKDNQVGWVDFAD